MKGKRGPDGRGRPVKVPVVQGTNGYVRPEMPTGDSGGREAIVPVAERRTTVATRRCREKTFPLFESSEDWYCYHVLLQRILHVISEWLT